MTDRPTQRQLIAARTAVRGTVITHDQWLAEVDALNEELTEERQKAIEVGVVNENMRLYDCSRWAFKTFMTPLAKAGFSSTISLKTLISFRQTSVSVKASAEKGDTA